MKAANIFVTYLLLILTLLSASCGKDEERSDLFDFDLNNGLSLEGTDEFLQLPMAYVDTLYEWDTVHLHFNDGAVGDSLITACGNWSYEENPTTTSEVWLTDTFVEDGIYEFSLGAGADDFSLIIRRDLIFFQNQRILRFLQAMYSSIDNRTSPYGRQHHSRNPIQNPRDC